MQISVIVPMYNVENYIVRCLDSILSQNTEDCEVILVNDGSRDDTVKKVREYLDGSPSKGIVKLIEKENSGASATRNMGIEAASGEFLVFVDADDCMAEGALELFKRTVRETEADLYAFGFFISDLKERVRSELCGRENFLCESADSLSCMKQYFERTGYLSTWQPWAKVFRKKIIDEHHVRYDTQLFSSNDFDFFFHYFRYVRSVRFDHTPVYVYTADRPGSITSTKLLMRAESNMRATARLFFDVRKRDETETVFADYVSRLYLGTLELCADMDREEIGKIRRLNQENEEIYRFSKNRLAVFKRFCYKVLGCRGGARVVLLIRKIEYLLKGKNGQLSVPRKTRRAGREGL